MRREEERMEGGREGGQDRQDEQERVMKEEWREKKYDKTKIMV